MVCVLVLKKDNPAYSFLITIAAGIVILYFAANMIRPVKVFMDELAEVAGLSPAILSPVFKAVGISIVTKITAEACRDAKEGAIGAYAELTGSAAALYVSLPLFSSVFKLIRSFFQI
jgi:stage III sporulation protein AD